MSDLATIVLALYRDVIGATLHAALKGEAGYLRRANRRSTTNSQVFVDFFLFAVLRLLASMNRRTNSIGAA
jgi:hypothetical protein